MRIEFTVLGNPRAQKRHRTRQLKDKNFSIRYDPCAKEKNDFFRAVQHHAPEVLFKGPIRVELVFFLPRPKDHYGTGKNANKLKKTAPEWHIKKPDIDNLVKWILDALSSVFWSDDSIICDLYVAKRYDEKPRTVIVIETLT